MTIVKEGQKVCLSFEAKLETGETVLKTEDEKPLETTLGEGAIPASIEKAVVDMKVGETKEITLDSAETFGPKRDELIVEVPKEGFGPETPLEIGTKVSMNSPEGKQYIGTIINVGEEKITLDFNHPLAGKSLIFTITVVSVN